jgi:hypothetical protein
MPTYFVRERDLELSAALGAAGLHDLRNRRRALVRATPLLARHRCRAAPRIPERGTAERRHGQRATPDLRACGVAIATMAMHLLGDAASRWLIGVASDRVGLIIPVLGPGLLLGASGLILLLGARSLDHDLRTAAA